jgi:hypothetical protein
MTSDQGQTAGAAPNETPRSGDGTLARTDVDQTELSRFAERV